MQSSASTCVHVVDDDEAMRESLRVLLKSANVPVKTYISAEDFVDSANSTVRGCLLLDVSMPGMSGLELQKIINTKKMPLPVVFMTGHGDVDMAVAAMKAGAVDFIEKPFDPDMLLGKLKTCLARAEEMHAEHEQQTEIAGKLATLTARERQVLDLLVEGKSNKDIAAHLGNSVRTVEVHRAKIMEKLGANTVADIVRLVYQGF